MAEDTRTRASAPPPGGTETPPPLEEPMSYDQAILAVILCRSLEAYRDRKGLRWRLDVNERVEHRRADGSTRIVFPDLYAVTGSPQGKRGPYRTWLRRRRIDFVVEFSTRDSIGHDRGEKLAIYRDELRVAEYFIFDVDGADLADQLEGYRLEDGLYRPIEAIRADGSFRLPSAVLGVELGPRPNADEEVELRAFEPGASEPLPTPQEAELRERDAELSKTRALLEEYRRRFGPLSP